jgi:hypothetical protein
MPQGVLRPSGGTWRCVGGGGGRLSTLSTREVERCRVMCKWRQCAESSPFIHSVPYNVTLVSSPYIFFLLLSCFPSTLSLCAAPPPRNPPSYSPCSSSTPLFALLYHTIVPSLAPHPPHIPILPALSSTCPCPRCSPPHCSPHIHSVVQHSAALPGPTSPISASTSIYGSLGRRRQFHVVRRDMMRCGHRMRATGDNWVTMR